MNYGEIKFPDIANGEGVRVSLFVSGCTHRCRGCFNPQTWDFSFGKPFTSETESYLLSLLENDFVSGLTLLGGEPLEAENQAVLLPFVRRVKETFPTKTVWCYSGYTWESLLARTQAQGGEITRQLLSYLDVLVDGPFLLEEKSVMLQFRGSRNQRVLDVRASLAMGEPVFWQGLREGR